MTSGPEAQPRSETEADAEKQIKTEFAQSEQETELLEKSPKDLDSDKISRNANLACRYLVACATGTTRSLAGNDYAQKWEELRADYRSRSVSRIAQNIIRGELQSQIQNLSRERADGIVPVVPRPWALVTGRNAAGYVISKLAERSPTEVDANQWEAFVRHAANFTDADFKSFHERLEHYLRSGETGDTPLTGGMSHDKVVDPMRADETMEGVNPVHADLQRETEACEEPETLTSTPPDLLMAEIWGRINDLTVEHTKLRAAHADLRRSLATIESELSAVEGRSSREPDAASLLLSIKRRVGRLEAIVTAKDTKQSPIREDLPAKYRNVLQAILDLGKSEFAEGERLLATLNGERITESFANSLKAVLRAKEWGATCQTCGKPSVITWHSNDRYAEGGRAHFSHSGSSPHGSITTIGDLKFVMKIDRRKKR